MSDMNFGIKIALRLEDLAGFALHDQSVQTCFLFRGYGFQIMSCGKMIQSIFLEVGQI